MTYEEKIFFVCGSRVTVSFAYERLFSTIDAARMQMKRIWSQISSLPKQLELSPTDPEFQNKAKEYKTTARANYRPIFNDIHFYFITWGGIRSMMGVIAKQPEFKEANIIFNSHRKTIEHYINARNTFEHFDDRLPGGKNHERVKEVRAQGASPRKILKGISREGYYLHSDKKWNIKPSSLKLLEEITQEFIKSVNGKIDILLKEKNMKP